MPYTTGYAPIQLRRKPTYQMKCAHPKCENHFKPFGEKKYCSLTCRTRVNSLTRYHKLMNDEEYRKARRKFLKEWHWANREKHNAQMRRLALIRYYRLKEKGICPICLKKVEGKVYHTECGRKGK